MHKGKTESSGLVLKKYRGVYNTNEAEEHHKESEKYLCRRK